MSKYKVNVHTPMEIPEIIEADSKIQAQEKIINIIMDYIDIYLDIVAEEIEENDECEDESLYKDESNKITRALEINEKIIEEYKINYGDKLSKLLLSLKMQNDILKGDDCEN